MFADLSGFSNGSASGPGASTSTVDGSTIVDGSTVDGSTTGDQPQGDASNGAVFHDDFERPDGPVGNGWLQKVGGAFSLRQGRLRMMDGSHQDLVLARPAAEDVRDVEVAIEVIYTSTPTASSTDAYVAARIQRSTLTTPGNSDAYVGYIADYTRLKIGRSLGDNVATLRDVPLPKAVDTSHAYRLRLRVTGTSPVALSVLVEERALAAQEWTKIAETQFNDGDPSRIEQAGAVGVVSDTRAPYEFEWFTRTAL